MTPPKATDRFDRIVLFGGRGHSLILLRGLQSCWRGAVLGVVDEIDNGFDHPLLGVPVVSAAQRQARWPDVPVMLTPADPALRERIAGDLAAQGATLVTLHHRASPDVDPSAQFGPASLCAPFTRIGPNVQIGTGCQVMATMLAHDITLGDFTTVNAYATVLGHVRIGARVTIAPHAVIGNGRPGRPLVIGDDAVIGVGAVVTRDVPAGARMIGNPAMPVDRWRALNRLIDAAEAGDG